jgi:hypothetical protein
VRAWNGNDHERCAVACHGQTPLPLLSRPAASSHLGYGTIGRSHLSVKNSFRRENFMRAMFVADVRVTRTTFDARHLQRQGYFLDLDLQCVWMSLSHTEQLFRCTMARRNSDILRHVVGVRSRCRTRARLADSNTQE